MKKVYTERSRSGFTLVELLVVMAVLSLMGVLILTIFTRTLRSSNKSQILGVIKQNGQAVLENMDKTIREADNVVCTSLSSDTLVVVKDGIYTRYRIILPSPPLNPTTNGFIQQDTPVQPEPPAAESDIKLFIDNVCTDPLFEPKTLTDTNPKSGVSVVAGYFSRSKTAGFKDQVTVSFTLKGGVEVASAIAGQIDPVTFSTTVQLR